MKNNFLLILLFLGIHASAWGADGMTGGMDDANDTSGSLQVNSPTETGPTVGGGDADTAEDDDNNSPNNRKNKPDEPKVGVVDSTGGNSGSTTTTDGNPVVSPTELVGTSQGASTTVDEETGPSAAEAAEVADKSAKRGITADTKGDSVKFNDFRTFGTKLSD